MKSSLRINTLEELQLGRHWRSLLTWGILLLVLGIIALAAANYTTLLTVMVFGVILLIGGLIILVDAFTNWWGRWGGFLLHLLIGILYGALGVTLIQNPLWGSATITLLIGVFYLVLGGFRMIESLIYRIGPWGWMFFSGVISALLGFLILNHWPNSSLYIIGLFIGVDLLFGGWAYIMVALGLRSLTKA